MKQSEIVNTLLFDYESLAPAEIDDLCDRLPKKLLRWLGTNHPDNRTRKIFFRKTNVSIGSDTVINSNFLVSDGYLPLLSIGDRVAISPNVTVVCESGPNNSRLQEDEYVKEKLICDKPVIIGNDVWVGSNVVILPGVTIGDFSIIGAGSVVSRNVPPRSVAAGIPARVIRSI